MNATIAVCMLLLGEVTIPQEGTGTLPLLPPTSLQMPMTSPFPLLGDPAEDVDRTAPGRPGMPGAGMGGMNRQRRAAGAGMRGAGMSREPLLPLSPTDPIMGQSQLLPSSPTAGATMGGMGAGRYGTPGVAGRGGQRGSYQPFAQSNAIRARQPAYYGGGNNEDKPFSAYRQSPSVSPYLNLFRSHTGGVDNYTTLVRPQLEQRAMNQKFSGQIGGVENTLHRQGSSLQQLNQETQMMQGIVNPQYFINYQQYYPGTSQTAPPLGSP